MPEPFIGADHNTGSAAAAGNHCGAPIQAAGLPIHNLTGQSFVVSHKVRGVAGM